MLSYGDSTSYAAIVDLHRYGPNVSIAKLECINHAGKQLGTSLRSLARKEHLGGCGAGKLTEKKLGHPYITIEQLYKQMVKM